MHARISRRALAALPAVLLAKQDASSLAEPVPAWLPAPIGWPGRVSGDGFLIGHGFQCENSWFTPGWWHTGEDWYARDEDTAGAEIRAVAPGTVVYADFDYPGRVVIVQHEVDLYSVYGHLDYALAVEAGQAVETGSVLGVVLQQAPERGYRQAPSHLHFEIRRFLIRDDVNGTNPGYGVRCGYQCPPGPGYWPQSAPTLPVDLLWLHPTHARLAAVVGGPLQLQPQVAGQRVTVDLRDEPDGARAGAIEVNAGTRLTVRNLVVGDAETRETAAGNYVVWAEVETAGGGGWLQVAVPSDVETGVDGRPSSVEFPFLLVPGDATHALGLRSP